MSFAAKYPGTCGFCDQDINPGDIVTYPSGGHATSNEVVHVDCPYAVDGLPGSNQTGHPPEPTTDVCPTCWQSRAANGTCGCDE